jgi:hypothetical protein
LAGVWDEENRQLETAGKQVCCSTPLAGSTCAPHLLIKSLSCH